VILLFLFIPICTCTDCLFICACIKQQINFCEKNCGRNCAAGLEVEAVARYRRRFWETVPTAIQRRQKVAQVLDEARDTYLKRANIKSLDPSDNPDQLIFNFNGKDVCQKFYANLLGMATPEGYKSKQWVDETNIYLKKKERDAKSHHNGMKAGEGRRDKREHAYAYIMTLVDSQIVDKSAHQNYDNHLYLPYHTLTALFDEYVYLCRQQHIPSYAQRTTFALALKQVKFYKKQRDIHIRLSGGKGMYPVSACLHACYHLLRC
jgi:hypothetical protein